MTSWKDYIVFFHRCQRHTVPAGKECDKFEDLLNGLRLFRWVALLETAYFPMSEQMFL